MSRWSSWVSLTLTLLPLLIWAIVAERAAFSGEGGQEGGWRPRVRPDRLPRLEAPRAGDGSVPIPQTAVRKWIQLGRRNRILEVHREFGEVRQESVFWTHVLAAGGLGNLIYYDRHHETFQVRSADFLGNETVEAESASEFRGAWDFDWLESSVALPGENPEWLGYRAATGTASVFEWDARGRQIRERLRGQPFAMGCTSVVSGQFVRGSPRVLWACYQAHLGRIEFLEEAGGRWIRRYRVAAPPNAEILRSIRWSPSSANDALLLYNSDMARLRIFELDLSIAGRSFLALRMEERGGVVPSYSLPLVVIGGWSRDASPSSEVLIYDASTGDTRLLGVSRTGAALEQRGRWLMAPNANSLSVLNLPRLQLPPIGDKPPRVLRSSQKEAEPRSDEKIELGGVSQDLDLEGLIDFISPRIPLEPVLHWYSHPLRVKLSTVLVGNDSAAYPSLGSLSAPTPESGFSRVTRLGRSRVGNYSLDREIQRLNRDFQSAGIQFDQGEVILLRRTDIAQLPHAVDPSWGVEQRAAFTDTMESMEEYSKWIASAACRSCTLQKGLERTGQVCQWGVPESNGSRCDSYARSVCSDVCMRPSEEATSESPGYREELIQFVRRSDRNTGSNSWKYWGFINLTDDAVDQAYFPAHELGHFFSLPHSHLDPLVLHPDPLVQGDEKGWDVGDIPKGDLYLRSAASRRAYCDDEVGLSLVAPRSICGPAGLGLPCRERSESRLFKGSQTNVMAYGYGECILTRGLARGFTRDQAWRMRKWLLRQRPGLIQSPSESGESQ